MVVGLWGGEAAVGRCVVTIPRLTPCGDACPGSATSSDPDRGHGHGQAVCCRLRSTYAFTGAVGSNSHMTTISRSSDTGTPKRSSAGKCVAHSNSLFTTLMALVAVFRLALRHTAPQPRGNRSTLEASAR